MGYEGQMQEDILALLQLFRDRVPDPETHAWVVELVNDNNQWKYGHKVFDRVRGRNLKAIQDRHHSKQCQYCFEEVCLESFYNETYPHDPFDSCSPYWVIKNALLFARAIDVDVQDVVAIVAPDTRHEHEA
jgi:hypothetical protein